MLIWSIFHQFGQSDPRFCIHSFFVTFFALFRNDVIFWLIDKYGINDVNDATKYYEIVVERGFTRGRKTAQVAVAYLYVVCR
ncbi:putative Cyclin-like superfamily [Helianthus annuus]|nr:putative Cyclin-like superfamily [Helianthus annuus]